MNTSRSDRSRRGFLIANLVTGLLAAAALGYALGHGDPADDRSPAGFVPDRAVWSRLVAEVEVLRGDLSNLQDDVAVLRGRVTAAAIPSTGSGQPPDPWRREFDALTEQLRALQATTVAMLPAGEADPPVVDAHGPAGTSSAAADVQDMMAADAVYFDAMDARFVYEAPDPVWSRTAEQTVERALRSPELASIRPGGIECRSSLCRFDVWLEDESEELEMLLMPLLGERFERLAVEVPPEAGGRRTVYLGRHDRAFADLPRQDN